MASAWIQRHDFSAEDLGVLSTAEVICAFNAVDWQTELSLGAQKGPDASCPPGFGINLDESILHLCPSDTQNMFFHLHHRPQVKLLGLIPIRRRRSHYVERYPTRHAKDIISHFMAGDFAPILAIL